MSAPVLVCFAVIQEAKPFLKAVRGRASVRVLVTGMGARNAERIVREALPAFRPASVFTCGFAGALRTEWRVGDVLFDQVTTSDDCARKLIAAGAKAAAFHSSARVAITGAEKSALRTESGADAVEMESGVIQRVCAEAKVPCTTVRAISDRATDDLPLDFNALMARDQNLSYARLSLALLRKPRAVAGLIQLARHSALAAQALARVLQQII